MIGHYHITALKKSCMAGRNIGKKYIIAVNRLIRCCFSSFCGVSTYKFNRYPSSQASADPTSDVHIVAFPFSIYKSVTREKNVKPERKSDYSITARN